jgi:hypothetical protein
LPAASSQTARSARPDVYDHRRHRCDPGQPSVTWKPCNNIVPVNYSLVDASTNPADTITSGGDGFPNLVADTMLTAAQRRRAVPSLLSLRDASSRVDNDADAARDEDLPDGMTMTRTEPWTKTLRPHRLSSACSATRHFLRHPPRVQHIDLQPRNAPKLCHERGIHSVPHRRRSHHGSSQWQPYGCLQPRRSPTGRVRHQRR